MPRSPRIQYEGAVYHVMSRGDHGEPVYQDDADRAAFLECLGRTCGKTGWSIHAYVLMHNHYHLLLETPQANLVAGMHWLQSTYTQRYNRRHGLHGHLFQGRYKPLLVDPEEDSYFLQVSTYIHLNPLRAGLVRLDRRGLAAYPWSSFPAYLATRRGRPVWLSVQRVLAALGVADSAAGRRAYAQHVAQRARDSARGEPGDLDQARNAIRRGWCLGTDDFRSRMEGLLRKSLGDDRSRSYSGPAVEEHWRRTAEDLLAAGLAAVGLRAEELTDLRKTDPRKQLVAWLVRKNSTARNAWVSQQLGMGHEVNVSQAVRRVETASRGELAQLKQRVTKALRSKD